MIRAPSALQVFRLKNESSRVLNYIRVTSYLYIGIQRVKTLNFDFKRFIRRSKHSLNLKIEYHTSV